MLLDQLDHTSATATVSVTGLALGCYNPYTSNWEVALIRHPRHVLKINVTKQTSHGPETIPVEVDEQQSIIVDAKMAISPANPLFMPTATFDRLGTENDPEDLRWVVDLENELNDGNPVVLKHPEFPVTPMFVSQPVLYANREMFVGDEKTRLVNTLDNSVVRAFGKLAEAANADICCQDGGAVILRITGPNGYDIELPHIAGSPHKIEIENLCPDPPEGATEGPSSDFTLYYSVVKDTLGEKFDLKLDKGTGEGDGAVCNKTFLGVTDHLFPLP